MRIRVRSILMVLAAAATTAVISAGHAEAGGPTIVLVVNPATGEAGALYITDQNYQLLHDSLEPAPGMTVERPPQLSAGPGTSAINITWLAHDVSVWRVDHIRLDLKYVWVQTITMGDGASPYDSDAEWHVAAGGDAVIGVLHALGVLPNGAPGEGTSAAGTASSAGHPSSALEPAAEPAAEEPASAASPLTDWQWLAAAAAAGLAVGAIGRPALAESVRRRTRGARQQLVDLELDRGAGSAQADSDPAKAPSLVLDLGDLDPADLSR